MTIYSFSNPMLAMDLDLSIQYLGLLLGGPLIFTNTVVGGSMIRGNDLTAFNELDFSSDPRQPFAYVDFINQNIPAHQARANASAERSTYEYESVDKPYLYGLTIGGSRTTSTQSLSLVGTGATGTQISSTKDSAVKFTVGTSATATIAGGATSVVALKICATNNATEASWTTVATQETDQTISLAITLQSIAAQKGQLCADVPAGWYVKLVNNGTGTHSESFVSGQKTIYD